MVRRITARARLSNARTVTAQLVASLHRRNKSTSQIARVTSTRPVQHPFLIQVTRCTSICYYCKKEVQQFRVVFVLSDSYTLCRRCDRHVPSSA